MVLEKYGGSCSKSINKNTSYVVQGVYGLDRWKKKIDVNLTA